MTLESGRTLSDADIEALKVALNTHHQCRFAIPQEEFEATWPVMRDLATSIHTAQSITLRIIVTGTVLFVLGLVARGIWGWVTEMHTRIPLLK